jgi:hypothetical protein
MSTVQPLFNSEEPEARTAAWEAHRATIGATLPVVLNQARTDFEAGWNAAAESRLEAIRPLEGLETRAEDIWTPLPTSAEYAATLRRAKQAEHDRDHWRANHDHQVEVKRRTEARLHDALERLTSLEAFKAAVHELGAEAVARAENAEAQLASLRPLLEAAQAVVRDANIYISPTMPGIETWSSRDITFEHIKALHAAVQPLEGGEK